MKIESMDATSALKQTQEQNTNKVQQKQSENANISATLDLKGYTHLSAYEKSELPVPDKMMIEAIEKANKAILGSNRSFEFSIHQKTKAIVVKVVDSDTHEVIREIPSEKVLDMVAKMWEMAGIMLDERR
ncbi:MAG: flagellar protein FlaG [Bacillota bacterium]|nr:flagellar protein FlaG [Bacillota bacterium]